MEIVFEKKTDKTIADAMASLKDHLKENSFGVLFELNFKDKLNEKGIEFADDYYILEVCNPKEAKKVLDKNIQAGYILPCKMVVRSEGENTYIGMTSPEALMNLYEQKDLNDFAEGIEETLRNVIEASI